MAHLTKLDAAYNLLLVWTLVIAAYFQLDNNLFLAIAALLGIGKITELSYKKKE